jgi:hypothetical protein
VTKALACYKEIDIGQGGDEPHRYNIRLLEREERSHYGDSNAEPADDYNRS